MFDALQYEKNEGFKLGYEIGYKQGLVIGMIIGEIIGLYSLNITPEEIAVYVNQPIEFVKEVLNL